MKLFFEFFWIIVSFISVIKSTVVADPDGTLSQPASSIVDAVRSFLDAPFDNARFVGFFPLIASYIPTFINNKFKIEKDLMEPLSLFKYLCILREIRANPERYRHHPHLLMTNAKRNSLRVFVKKVEIIFTNLNIDSQQIQQTVPKLIVHFNWDRTILLFTKYLSCDILTNSIDLILKNQGYLVKRLVRLLSTYETPIQCTPIITIPPRPHQTILFISSFNPTPILNDIMRIQFTEYSEIMHFFLDYLNQIGKLSFVNDTFPSSIYSTNTFAIKCSYCSEQRHIISANSFFSISSSKCPWEMELNIFFTNLKIVTENAAIKSFQNAKCKLLATDANNLSLKRDIFLNLAYAPISNIEIGIRSGNFFLCYGYSAEFIRILFGKALYSTTRFKPLARSIVFVESLLAYLLADELTPLKQLTIDNLTVIPLFSTYFERFVLTFKGYKIQERINSVVPALLKAFTDLYLIFKFNYLTFSKFENWLLNEYKGSSNPKRLKIPYKVKGKYCAECSKEISESDEYLNPLCACKTILIHQRCYLKVLQKNCFKCPICKHSIVHPSFLTKYLTNFDSKVIDEIKFPSDPVPNDNNYVGRREPNTTGNNSVHIYDSVICYISRVSKLMIKVSIACLLNENETIKSFVEKSGDRIFEIIQIPHEKIQLALETFLRKAILQFRTNERAVAIMNTFLNGWWNQVKKLNQSDLNAVVNLNI